MEPQCDTSTTVPQASPDAPPLASSALVHPSFHAHTVSGEQLHVLGNVPICCASSSVVELSNIAHPLTSTRDDSSNVRMATIVQPTSRQHDNSARVDTISTPLCVVSSVSAVSPRLFSRTSTRLWTQRFQRLQALELRSSSSSVPTYSKSSAEGVISGDTVYPPIGESASGRTRDITRNGDHLHRHRSHIVPSCEGLVPCYELHKLWTALEDLSITQHIELAAIERLSTPLSRLHADTVAEGSITVDQKSQFSASVIASHGTTPLDLRALLDTGCNASSVSDATLQRMITHGAARQRDIVRLTQPIEVAGFKRNARKQLITSAVWLQLTTDDSAGSRGATFSHVFLIVPHLSHDIFFGRDILNRHRYSVHSSQGTSIYHFSASLPAVPTLAERAASVAMLTTCCDSGWKLVASCEHELPVGRDVYIRAHIVEADGVTPVPLTDTTSPSEYVAHITLPGLSATDIVLGVGECSIPIRTLSDDITLHTGDVIGDIESLETLSAEVVPAVAPKPTAVDLFCGVGGFSLGAKQFVDVRVATDVSADACAVYSVNQADTHVLTGNILDPTFAATVVGTCIRECVSVAFASPPTHASTTPGSSQTDTNTPTNADSACPPIGGSASWRTDAACALSALEIVAEVPTIRVLVLEHVAAFTTTVEHSHLVQRAFTLGFQHRAITVNGSDCGLATRRTRVLTIFVRADVHSDPVQTEEMLNGLCSLHDGQRGLAGHTSVSAAIGGHLAASGDTSRLLRDKFKFADRYRGTSTVHSMLEPAPRLHGTMLRAIGRSEPAQGLRDLASNSCSDSDSSNEPVHLTWAELKAVASFGTDFVWREPESSSVVHLNRNSTLLARASAPRMAAYVCSLLQRSGLLEHVPIIEIQALDATTSNDSDCSTRAAAQATLTNECKQQLRQALLPTVARDQFRKHVPALIAASLVVALETQVLIASLAVQDAADVSAPTETAGSYTATSCDSETAAEPTSRDSCTIVGADGGQRVANTRARLSDVYMPVQQVALQSGLRSAALAPQTQQYVRSPTSACHSTVAQRLALLHSYSSIGIFYGQAYAGSDLAVTGGTALRDCTSTCPATAKVLQQMKHTLPEHLLSLKVEMHGWSPTQVTRLCALLLANLEVFSKNKWDVGYCDALPFHITLREDATAASDRPYRYSPMLNKLIKVEIDRLLAAGIIRTSNSEWASPVVAVLKKDGTARITVNYRKLNAMSKIPQMPLPHIEDILNSLGGSAVFTVMDITSGYFTSAIHQDSIPMTAMVTSFGLYEWLRCPQGAAGAPGHFTRLMSVVLTGLERVQPFIDDIIVHSASVEQHMSDLEQLFIRLSHHGIKLAPSKIHIGCRSVKFLGHVVEVAGVRPDADKVTALLNMPEPHDMTTLRSWLGLANYYRRFVKGMAKIIAPLTALTGKDVPFVIGDAERAAMAQVNTALSLLTLMSYPDFESAASGDSPFTLSTDASKDGFGAVLSQNDSAGVEKPIAFASRSTLKNEKNWSVTDLEAGAVVYGVKKFRHILWGSPFVILSDHRALQYLESCREKTARLARWFEFLSAFQYEIRYKQGATHCNADGISRNPLPATAEHELQEQHDQLVEAYALESSTPVEVLAAAVLQVQELYNSIDSVLADADGPTHGDTHVQDTSSELHTWSAFASHDELGLMTGSDWQTAQERDTQLLSIIQYVRDRKLPADKAQALLVQRLSRHCHMQTLGGVSLLVRRDWSAVARDEPRLQLVVPKSHRDQVLNCLHGSAWGGHQGTQRTVANVRKHVWWPGWEVDTAFWAEHCWPCQARKRSGKLNHWPEVFREMPPCAFDTVAVDFFGPLPPTTAGHTHILVVQDLYSRWVHAYAMHPAQVTAIGVAEVLVDHYYTLHGVARVLLSDRGSQFASELSKAVHRFMGTRKLFTTAYHPQCNGMVERFMQSLAQMLAMVVCEAHNDWHLWLNHVAFAYNNSENKTTGVTPFLLAAGREPRIAMHQILGQLNDDVLSDLPPSIKDLVTQVVSRQRNAQRVVLQRYELRRQYIMRKNEAVARAMGLRHQFVAGELVWNYRAPVTHTVKGSTNIQVVDSTAAAGSEAHAVQLSRKFLNYWHGPYAVLAVGPAEYEGIKVGRNCLLVLQGTKRVHLSVHLCKRCKDPTAATDKDIGLPSGFARYLLMKGYDTLHPPTALTDDIVTYESDRHGVVAILDHRVRRQARNRPNLLEYKVRWEGEAVADTWEPAVHLDACREAVDEYWQHINTSAERHNTAVKFANTAVVRGRRQQAKARVQPVQIDRDTYTLPAGVQVLPVCPPAHLLRSQAFVGSRILQKFAFSKDSGDQYTEWCEGVVRKPPAAVVRDSTHKSMFTTIKFAGTAQLWEVLLNERNYSTDMLAEEGSWVVFGEQAALDKLT